MSELTTKQAFIDDVDPSVELLAKFVVNETIDNYNTGRQEARPHRVIRVYRVLPDAECVGVATPGGTIYVDVVGDMVTCASFGADQADEAMSKALSLAGWAPIVGTKRASEFTVMKGQLQ